MHFSHDESWWSREARSLAIAKESFCIGQDPGHALGHICNFNRILPLFLELFFKIFNMQFMHIHYIYISANIIFLSLRGEIRGHNYSFKLVFRYMRYIAFCKGPLRTSEGVT